MDPIFADFLHDVLGKSIDSIDTTVLVISLSYAPS